jgi:isopentenyldiphosphate isomerase
VSYPPIQIVDENDKPLRPGTMTEAQAEGLWHRIVRIIVKDQEGRILLQKRGATMATFPGCWDTSASGHVDNAEDYLTAAKREMAEEIGLQEASLEEVESYQSRGLYEGRKLNRFNKTYLTFVKNDQIFTADPVEVSEIKWFTPEAIRALLEERPSIFSDGLKHFLKFG